MKKKLVISKLFLYKHRFTIGYILLAIAFLGLVFSLPLLSPNGLSDAEMRSAVTSNNTHFASLPEGDIIDLPYRVLQKLSITLFGLSAYSIKLPSMILGIILGVLLVLLLNRWFKRNVALLASIISVLAVAFFFLSGTGTPMIMFVFWPTLLLWLGGKVQGKNDGKNQPRPLWAVLLSFALILSAFTPYMIYLVVFIIIFVLTNPHLRFTVKQLPKIPLFVVIIIMLGGLGLVGFCAVQNWSNLLALVFTNDFSIGKYFANLGDAFLPFFTWTGNIEGIFLAPVIGLASIALAVIGIISTAKGFFASRNALAVWLVIFTVVFAGFNSSVAALLVLPLAILVAHGLRYLLEKWYGLFPENPYARVFAIVPISILMAIMIVSDLSHFVFGYRYSPPVAGQFSNDLALVQANLQNGDTLLVSEKSLEYDFYKMLPQSAGINVVTDVPVKYSGHLATLGKWEHPGSLGQLDRIITSPKVNNSDRIYLYIEANKTEEK